MNTNHNNNKTTFSPMMISYTYPEHIRLSIEFLYFLQ